MINYENMEITNMVDISPVDLEYKDYYSNIYLLSNKMVKENKSNKDDYVGEKQIVIEYNKRYISLHLYWKEIFWGIIRGIF